MKKIVMLIVAVIMILGIALFVVMPKSDKKGSNITPGIIKNTAEATSIETEPGTRLNIESTGDSIKPMAPGNAGDTNNLENSTSSEISNNREEVISNSNDIGQYVVSDDTPQTELDTEELKAAQSDMAKIESQIAENISVNTSRDAINMYREIAKDNVKRLVNDGHAEFNGITDSDIDNYSEDELMELVWKITQIN